MKKIVAACLMAFACLFIASPINARLVSDAVAINSLHQLTNSELKTFFANISIGPECCDRAEEFYQDGVYIYMGYAREIGTYTIENNMVCVHLKTRNDDCRLFFLDKNKTLFVANPNEITAHPIEVRRLNRSHHL